MPFQFNTRFQCLNPNLFFGPTALLEGSMNSALSIRPSVRVQRCFSRIDLSLSFDFFFWSSDVVVKTLDALCSSPRSKTAGWLQGLLSFSSFCSRLNEYQEELSALEELSGKSKLSPHSGSTTFRQLNLIHKKRP